MIGDGVITHELSDRLAESLESERLEELRARIDDDEGYLSAEWASNLFRLRDLERTTGRQILTPDTFIHAALESNRMKSLDWLELADIEVLSEAAIQDLQPEARAMYNAHSGIHSMLHRQDRLEAAATIFLRSLEIDSQPDMYAARLTANMYEELAWYDMFEGRVGRSYEAAAKLNSLVVEADNSWANQYKIHARMSQVDLQATAVLAEANLSEANQQLYRNLRRVHLNLNESLDFLSDQLVKYLDESETELNGTDDPEKRKNLANHFEGRARSATGTLAEGMALSFSQDYILKNRLQDKYWAMQAFMRQDVMGRRRIVKGSEKEEDKLRALNITFDIQIFNHTDPEGLVLPIEVKKKDSAKRDSLHPDIQIARLGIKGDPRTFTETAKNFASGQIAKHSNQEPTAKEREVYKEIEEKLKPDTLFLKLNA